MFELDNVEGWDDDTLAWIRQECERFQDFEFGRITSGTHDPRAVHQPQTTNKIDTYLSIDGRVFGNTYIYYLHPNADGFIVQVHDTECACYKFAIAIYTKNGKKRFLPIHNPHCD